MPKFGGIQLAMEEAKRDAENASASVVGAGSCWGAVWGMPGIDVDVVYGCKVCMMKWE